MSDNSTSIDVFVAPPKDEVTYRDLGKIATPGASVCVYYATRGKVTFEDRLTLNEDSNTSKKARYTIIDLETGGAVHAHGAHFPHEYDLDFSEAVELSQTLCD